MFFSVRICACNSDSMLYSSSSMRALNSLKLGKWWISLIFKNFVNKSDQMCFFRYLQNIKKKTFHKNKPIRLPSILVTQSTHLGNFDFISHWPNFLMVCMYSPKSITWIVPATQNMSVWYDHERPSCISVHVNPSVSILCVNEKYFSIRSSNCSKFSFYFFKLSFFSEKIHVNCTSKIDESNGW